MDFICIPGEFVSIFEWVEWGMKFASLCREFQKQATEFDAMLEDIRPLRYNLEALAASLAQDDTLAHNSYQSARKECHSTFQEIYIKFGELRWKFEAKLGNNIFRESENRCLDSRSLSVNRRPGSHHLKTAIMKKSNLAELINSLSFAKLVLHELNIRVMYRTLYSHKGHNHWAQSMNTADTLIGFLADGNKISGRPHKLEEFIMDRGASITETRVAELGWISRDCGESTGARSSSQNHDRLQSGDLRCLIIGMTGFGKSAFMRTLHQEGAPRNKLDNVSPLQAAAAHGMYDALVILLARTPEWRLPITLPSPKLTYLDYQSNDTLWNLKSSLRYFRPVQLLSKCLRYPLASRGPDDHNDTIVDNFVRPYHTFGRHGEIKPEHILWFYDWQKHKDKDERQIADFGWIPFHRSCNAESLLRNCTLDSIREYVDVAYDRVGHQSLGDDSLLGPNIGWHDWLIDAYLRVRYIHRRPTWHGLDVWVRSKCEMILGSALFWEKLDPIHFRETVARLHSVFQSLLRVPRGGRRRPSRFLVPVLPFLLTWVTPAAADLPVRENVDSHLRSSISSGDRNLLYEIQRFLNESTRPWRQGTEAAMSPEALLLACFLCTSLTVLHFSVKLRDNHQKYFLASGIAFSAIVGAACSEGAQDFIFRYLFLGVNLALILSRVYHVRYYERRNCSMEYSKQDSAAEKCRAWN